MCNLLSRWLSERVSALKTLLISYGTRCLKAVFVDNIYSNCSLLLPATTTTTTNIFIFQVLHKVNDDDDDDDDDDVNLG